MNPDRIPVVLPEDLATLNDDEIVEGYFAGRRGEQCEPTRSRSYWHGWRNGLVDGGHDKTDAEQMMLAHLWLKQQRVDRIIAEAQKETTNDQR